MALGRTHIVAPLGATETERRIVQRTNIALRALDRRKPIAEPSVFLDNQSRPSAESSQGRIIFVRQANGTVQGQYSDGATWQTFLATSVSFAVPTVTYATAAVAGSLATTIRSDATLKFPTALMSAANSSTLTLTDDGTDGTLTQSLGGLILSTASNKFTMPYWNAAGGTTPTVGTVLAFQALSGTVGTSLTEGIVGSVSFNDASTYSGVTKRGAGFTVATTNTSGATYTNLTLKALTGQVTAVTHSSGTHSYTERTGLELTIGGALQSGGGAVTVTDTHGLRILGYPTIGTGGTQTNARSARIQFPTIGATIRRGVSVETVANNLGTEAANTEGFYCEDLTRGTAQRANFYAEGATTGTPTDVYAFYQGTAHVVGTNRYGFRATGATTGTPTLCVGFYADAHSVGTTQWAFYSAGDESHMVGVQQDDNAKDVFGTGRDAEIYYDGTNLIIDPDVVGSGEAQIAGKAHVTGELEIDGALNHDGTTVGFYAVAPTTRSAAYTPTNVTTDRAYDANSTSIDEIADVLGTLIADLQLTGIIG